MLECQRTAAGVAPAYRRACHKSARRSSRRSDTRQRSMRRARHCRVRGRNRRQRRRDDGLVDHREKHRQHDRGKQREERRGRSTAPRSCTPRRRPAGASDAARRCAAGRARRRMIRGRRLVERFIHWLILANAWWRMRRYELADRHSGRPLGDCRDRQFSTVFRLRVTTKSGRIGARPGRVACRESGKASAFGADAGVPSRRLLDRRQPKAQQSLAGVPHAIRRRTLVTKAPAALRRPALSIARTYQPT